jgi:hypothetical protein
MQKPKARKGTIMKITIKRKEVFVLLKKLTDQFHPSSKHRFQERADESGKNRRDSGHGDEIIDLAGINLGPVTRRKIASRAKEERRIREWLQDSG